MNFFKLTVVLLLFSLTCHSRRIINDLSKCFGWHGNQALLRPICTSEIFNTTDIKINCINTSTAQIIGEYEKISIKCSAKVALDFDYDGFQPTESIDIRFQKTIQPNSSRQLISYIIYLDILSVTSLAKKYSANTTIPRSNTGLYTVNGVFDKSFKNSVYLFLEDPPSPNSLIYNSYTRHISIRNQGKEVLVPCRPSKLQLTPELLINEKVENRKIFYDPAVGFILPYHRDATKYSCLLENNLETRIDFLDLNGSLVPRLGFENLPPESTQAEITISSQVESHNGEFSVNFGCRVSVPPGSDMAVIHAANPAASRLRQEFVLPRYWNQSYSVHKGTQASPPGTLIVNEETLSGLVLCLDPKSHKIWEYATGFDRLVRLQPYGTNWSYFDISASPPVNHLLISLKDKNAKAEEVFINQTYTFKCLVRTHGLEPPVVWHLKYSNEEIKEVFIDYTLENYISEFDVKISENAVEVIAAASFWDREIWKNVSFKINPIKGELPIIINLEPNKEFKVGSINQVLKCEATGNPTPDLYWEKDDKVLEDVRLFSGVIYLDFDLVQASDTGDYVCRAVNLLGNVTGISRVEVTAETKNFGLIIGLPFAVFILTIFGAAIFFRFCRKENIGLTKQEIHDFKQGCSDEEKAEVTMDTEFVPHNALNVPYNVAYEIKSSDFQISKSEVLGSGAYGIVYKGIVKGTPVAVKTVKPNADKSYLKALLSEIKIMSYLGAHEFLVLFIGANTSELSKGMVYLFVEYCGMGSMEKYLRSNRQYFVQSTGYTNVLTGSVGERFSVSELLIWSYQICEGMTHLSKKKVIHGDLATRNVLIAPDMGARITDFGLARQLYNYQSYVKKNEEPLPWRWMAVESLRDLTFSTHSDVWSFGVTLWEIFSLAETPFPGLGWDIDFVDKLQRGLRMQQPHHSPPTLYEEVLLPCWHTDPKSRPSFELLSLQLLKLIKMYCPSFVSLKKPINDIVDDSNLNHYINAADHVRKLNTYVKAKPEFP